MEINLGNWARYTSQYPTQDFTHHAWATYLSTKAIACRLIDVHYLISELVCLDGNDCSRKIKSTYIILLGYELEVFQLLLLDGVVLTWWRRCAMRHVKDSVLCCELKSLDGIDTTE
jgi:hypothetical protein